MLMSRAATHAEPLRKGSRSEEDKMIKWEIVIPLAHLGRLRYVCFETVSTKKTVFGFI